MLGSRYIENESKENWILGILSRDEDRISGKLGEVGHRIVGAPFDIANIVLGNQGYLSATGYGVAGMNISHVHAHSQGLIDSVNLVDVGFVNSATAYSLPIGNIATTGVDVIIGELDLVNGMMFGHLLNWDTTIFLGG